MLRLLPRYYRNQGDYAANVEMALLLISHDFQLRGVPDRILVGVMYAASSLKQEFVTVF